MNTIKVIYSSVLATIAASIFVTAITVAAELSPALKNILAGLAGHHWLTKSIGVLVVYAASLALSYMFPPKQISQTALRRSLFLATVFVWIGFAIILLFFVQHYLKLF